MSRFPYPLVVADIGGTNARFAFATGSDAPLSPVRTLATARYPGLADAVEDAIAQSGMRPASVVVCAAGPVADRAVRLTNNEWIIDGPGVARALGLQQGLLLNDFEALGMTLPSLVAGDVRQIGSEPVGDPRRHSHLVIGPGTGLGVAALFFRDGRFIAMPSEAGHIAINAESRQESLIFDQIESPHGRLTAETILSGPGLVRLHRARLRAAGSPTGVTPHKPADILAMALADPAGDMAHCVRHFWDIIARFAGDMALAFLATGGVTLAGGILPRLIPFLDDQRFRASFEAKAPMASLCGRIPTQLLVNTNAALQGMRRVADDPDLFSINFPERCWL